MQPEGGRKQYERKAKKEEDDAKPAAEVAVSKEEIKGEVAELPDDETEDKPKRGRQ